MQLTELKRCTDWFRVHSFKNLDDPSGKIERREMVIPLDQYPYDFGLGPKARRPVLTSPVSKKIGETLQENWRDFHLLNRGITVVAKGIEYDNKTQRVRLALHEAPEEERLYGILDGGNTNARINQWREDLPNDEAAQRLPEAYVNAQVLIPGLNGAGELSAEMMDLLNDIKEARNTSVQVKAKSLADARRLFEKLKETLSTESYYADVSWREGDAGAIEALHLITLLMMFYPKFAKEANGEPSNAYGRRERCLEAYLKYAEEDSDELGAWISILPTLARLFDEIQMRLPDCYSGRFGKIDEVKIYDKRNYEKGSKKYRNTPIRSRFLGQEMRYQYPEGWLYPLFAAFRHLARPSKGGGTIGWRGDPVEFWQKHRSAMVERYEPHIREAGYEAKRIATNYICYQAMGQVVKDLYKDELPREAGIDE